MTPDTKHIINANATLRQALSHLNSLSGDTMTLFVIDNQNKLIGSLTDGDIRRALIAGASLDNSTAIDAAYKKTGTLSHNNINLDTLRELRKKNITLVPVIDSHNNITKIIDLKKTPTQLPLTAILMAGGKGERLRPLTLTTPKPLLEIEGKAIIDYNIEALLKNGIENIFVTVNYLAEKIEHHIKNKHHNPNIKTLRENFPMGTIGAATLAPLPQNGNTLVMNSDLLTTISFEEMYLRHRDTAADITIAVIPYQISVPFAILDIDGDNVLSIEEKPSYSHFANAGIYIIANHLLNSLPENKRTDATDLIQNAITNGLKVTYHPINGSWIDVGSPSDFAQAKSLMKHHKNFTSHN